MTVSETMVLAGAKALHEEWRASILPGGSNHSMRPIIRDETLFSWENLHPENRESYVRTARTALTAALSDQAGGWQDISTAPRDGTRIFATGGGLGHEIEIVNYNERVGCWDAPNDTLDDCDDEPQGYSRPTHWQPLPAPPPSSTAGEGK